MVKGGDRIAGVLLAAGRSRRFGSADKLRAGLRGRPLAAHAAGALAALDLPVTVVVAEDPEIAALLPGAHHVRPGAAAPAQSASLAAGIDAAAQAGATGALVVLADMPNVTPQLLQQVLDTGQRFGRAAAYDGRRSMPPAYFSAADFAALQAMTGDAGARALLTQLTDRAKVHAPPALLTDIDTPEDLMRLGDLE